VALEDPRHIVDLGCGSGLSTELLTARWPGAAVVGIDSSPAMLEKARERSRKARFICADIAHFEPDVAPDLIFANASLHWLDDHHRLLPRLLSFLATTGVLAFQIPLNLDEPSHRLMRELAEQPAYREGLREALGLRPSLADAETYYDLLAPHCDRVDLWVTRYLQAMESPRDIIDFYASTGLRPYLEALEGALLGDFLDAYEQRLGRAYATRADGRVLLAMPRLFIIARQTADQDTA
jgi:trans-aconitate 2-methyltransferase